VCGEECGEGVGLRDYICVWCEAAVHTQCRPSMSLVRTFYNFFVYSLLVEKLFYTSESDIYYAVHPVWKTWQTFQNLKFFQKSNGYSCLEYCPIDYQFICKFSHTIALHIGIIMPEFPTKAIAKCTRIN